MEIKITPFILFLILLITLVISTLFGNSFLLKEKEGFVSFGYNNADIVKVNIPQYSTDPNKQVTYLYDNLYFDGINGNLIEVDSRYCGNVRVSDGGVSGNVSCNDSTGTTINKLYITKRIQTSTTSTNTYSDSNNCNGTLGSNKATETALTNISSNTHFAYLTKCLTISNTSGYKYEVFYASWDNDTFIHIMGLDPNASSGMNIQSFYYNYDSMMMRYVPLNSNRNVPVYNQTFSSNDDANNGKLYKDSIYDQPKIYQITKYVKYDLVRGYILVLNSTNNYVIYNRKTGQVVTNTNTPIESLSTMVSWVIPDNNNGMIIVMAHGLNTILMIVHAESSQKEYKLSYCVRFTDKEVHLSSSCSGNLRLTDDAQAPPSPPPEDTSNNATSQNNALPCTDELSCKWYYYFKTIGNDPNILFKNDFIRKTQIVPPVCPTCPNCPNGGGVCTNCGGNGGSGTSGSESNILKDTASGAKNVGEEVVGGTVNLGKEVVGGTVGLGREVVTGTLGLGKEVVGGAVNLAKDAASGIYNLGKKSEDDKELSTNDSAFGYVPNNASTPVDQYSYYGALQSKGGNFMPVTADFSSFRR